MADLPNLEDLYFQMHSLFPAWVYSGKTIIFLIKFDPGWVQSTVTSCTFLRPASGRDAMFYLFVKTWIMFLVFTSNYRLFLNKTPLSTWKGQTSIIQNLISLEHYSMSHDISMKMYSFWKSTFYCHTRLHLRFSANLRIWQVSDGATTWHYCHETTHPPPARSPSFLATSK